jgi:LysR family transcriptional regulator, hydrogen peroxide-inducible genes activator
MGMLSLSHLRYAIAVARTGSFSAAARDCEVSQPTISSAIADLEDLLGARLFERSTRKLALTPAGDKLLPRIADVLAAVVELERGAEELATPTRKLLRVGLSPLVGAQRLALLFEPFGASHRDVEFVYKECSQGDMEARLDAGTIDVVCGTRLAAAKQRGRQLLFREGLRWIPPHGTAAEDRVELRQVARSRLVLTDGSCGLAPATRELFSRARLRLDEYAGHAISYAALEEWADLGIGGAILPSSHIRKARSARLEHDAKPVALTFEAVWRKDLIVAQHAKAFVSYVRTVVPKLVKGSAVAIEA